MTDAILEHWNVRATLGDIAGTPDLIPKELEHRAILAAVIKHRPATILEVGCGRGELARLIVASCPWVDYLAVDGAREMIAVARSQPCLRSRLRFAHRDIGNLPSGHFDMVITERMLINLPTWEDQLQGIHDITDRLNPGGRYVMCENSQIGLDEINHVRVKLGLGEIKAPWHNRYMRTEELQQVPSSVLTLEDCQMFSADYYFLSRIVNAKLSQDAGREPKYDAPINKLALSLPASVSPRFAQGRLWCWRKP